MGTDSGTQPQEPVSRTSSPAASQTLAQALAMLEHALNLGKSVPDDVVATLTAAQRQDESRGVGGMLPASSMSLTAAHSALARLIEPATPRTITYLSHYKDSIWRLIFNAPVPTIAHFMGLAILSLAVFIVSGKEVDLDLIGDFLWASSAPERSYAMAHLLAAAAIGASFQALFTINRYTTRNTFDPKYIPSYWIRWLLGVIAGFILAVVIPVDFTDATDTFTKPLLALLGGFSAQAVYEILKRLVDTVTSLVRGTADDVIESREEALKARMAQRAAVRDARLQRRLGAALSKLKAGDPDGTEQSLVELVGDLESDPDLQGGA